jgi:tripartite-type tricarboxylate transporter receptor subunit TctC
MNLLALKLLRVFACLLGICMGMTANAYPDKPVRLVVGFAPGGSDLSARLLAQRLSEIWGQAVVVENKPGAAGNIGADFVAKAPADGHTLLLLVNSYTINTTLYKNLNWELIRDFAPVSRYANSPMVLVVNEKLPAKTFAEFLVYAKTNNGKLNYGSAGTGTAPHLAGEMFALRSGLSMVHIPYKGSAPSVTALVADEVQFSFGAMSAFDSMVKAGRLRPLAVTTATRFGRMPEIPTVIESGIAGFDADIWYDIVAPAKTPAAIVKKISDDIAKVVAEPEMQAKLRDRGLEPAYLDSAKTSELIKQDVSRWKEIIQRLKLTLDE